MALDLVRFLGGVERVTFSLLPSRSQFIRRCRLWDLPQGFYLAILAKRNGKRRNIPSGMTVNSIQPGKVCFACRFRFRLL